MLAEVLILYVLAPVTGLGLGFFFSHPPVLSGRVALALSLVPYAGFVVAWVFC